MSEAPQLVSGVNGGTPAQQPTPAAQQIAAHFFNLARQKIDSEINDYSRRNHVPIEEIHVKANGAVSKPEKILIALTHQSNGIMILGSPVRVFSLELSKA